MENLGITNFFNRIYFNKKVLITGHTGFKGSWLAYYLHFLGAKVIGYSISSPTDPCHFDLLDLPVKSILADINDTTQLESVIKNDQPEIIFHLAAQALVRYSYEAPLETYQSNVMGTLSVLEAARKAGGVKALVMITTDKVYENKEWIWPYREEDTLGGYDLYSSSKACAEILVKSFRNSFFNIKDYNSSHQTLLCTTRAGNVIGGGDWAKDRLVPDIVKASVKNQATLIRNPDAIRPWQHVLEPLSGYLILGQKLLEGKKIFSGEWNFGPRESDFLSVDEVALAMKKHWNQIKITYQDANTKAPHEANILKLDSTKANNMLTWKPVWGIQEAIQKTIQWYKYFYESQKNSTEEQLLEYLTLAKEKKLLGSHEI